MKYYRRILDMQLIQSVERPLLALANETLQHQNPHLQVKLAIAFPGEIAVKGSIVYFNNSQSAAARAVFQLLEIIEGKQEIICHHSEWDRFLDEIEEQLETRFTKAVNLDRLRQKKRQD